MNYLKFYENSINCCLSFFSAVDKKPNPFFNTINHFQFHDYSNLDTGVKMLINTTLRSSFLDADLVFYLVAWTKNNFLNLKWRVLRKVLQKQIPSYYLNLKNLSIKLWLIKLYFFQILRMMRCQKTKEKVPDPTKYQFDT